MDNKVGCTVRSEEKEAYRIRHNARIRQRYATDSGMRLRIKEDAYRRYVSLRQEAIRHLGGRCSSPLCGWVGGCDDSRCLQIDHVHGDGASFYRKVLASIPGAEYQLLCANCNWIKRHENRELPQARYHDNSFMFVDRRKLRKRDDLGHYVVGA